MLKLIARNKRELSNKQRIHKKLKKAEEVSLQDDMIGQKCENECAECGNNYNKVAQKTDPYIQSQLDFTNVFLDPFSRNSFGFNF